MRCPSTVGIASQSLQIHVLPGNTVHVHAASIKIMCSATETIRALATMAMINVMLIGLRAV